MKLFGSIGGKWSKNRDDIIVKKMEKITIWGEYALSKVWSIAPQEEYIKVREDKHKQTPTLLWIRKLSDMHELSSPALGDVDGNGHLEIIIGSSDNKTYCLSGEDGSILWTYTTNGWTHVELNSPALGDVDGDGHLEVIIGSQDHKIYCLNGEDGSILWTYTTSDEIFGLQVDIPEDSQ